eukprot:s2320_g11.t2
MHLVEDLVLSGNGIQDPPQHVHPLLVHPLAAGYNFVCESTVAFFTLDFGALADAFFPANFSEPNEALQILKDLGEVNPSGHKP